MGRFIALIVHFRSEEKNLNKLSSHLKNLEKEEQNKPKSNRRKETI